MAHDMRLSVRAPLPRRACLHWIAASGLSAGAGLVSAPLRAQPAAGGAPAVRVDAAAEVAAALAHAAITIAAAARSADREIQRLLQQVSQLRGDVAAGRADAASLTVARQALVDRLAEKDHEFAVDMKILRDGLARLSETPDGAAALRRFNEGDVPGALGALDLLAEAQRAARRPQRDREDAEDVRQDAELAKTLQARRLERRGVEDAQPLRDIARLALDAQARLKLPLEQVLRRFQAVVQLDPRLSSDAVALARLHRQAGQLPAMASAADQAVRRALDPEESALALSEAGSARRLLGELRLARTHLERALELRREATQRLSTRLDLKRYLSVAHERLGELSLDEGRLADAATEFQHMVRLRGELLRAAEPALSARRDLVVALGQLMRVHLERGEVGLARKLVDEALRLAAEAPLGEQASLDGQRDKAVLLARQADLAWVTGDADGADRLYRESLELRTRLAQHDSSSVRLARDVVAVQVRRADVALHRSGNAQQALAAYEDALRRLESLRGPPEERSELQRDLVMVDMRVAVARWRSGHPALALMQLRRGIDGLIRMDRDLPGQHGVRRDLATLHMRAGDVAMAQRDFDGARRHWDAALELREALLKVDGQARTLRAALVEALNKLALAHVELRQPGRAQSLRQRASDELARLLREGQDSLSGVPDSAEVILSAALLADAMNDMAYAERIAPAIKDMRRRKQFSADDEARLDRRKRRTDQ